MKASRITIIPCISTAQSISFFRRIILNRFAIMQAMIVKRRNQTDHTIDSPSAERRNIDRRDDDRRGEERRDTTSWRTQIWKRTSLNQYCRRNNDRRAGERRIPTDRRLSLSMLE